MWRPVMGYEGLYEVSDTGDVRSLRSNRVLRPDRHRLGYRRVSLSVGGKVRRFQVHHLVLEAFVSPRPEGLDCNHKNGLPWDNRPSNLEWVTRAENELHKRRVLGKQIGADNPRCLSTSTWALSREDFDFVSNRSNSYAEIRDLYGLSKTTIKRIRNGTHWGVR